MLLDTKIVLITGGAANPHRAAAHVFAREGAKVVVAGILVVDGGMTAA
jgi:NAD(P)-dependent dehydrogenase (short-subunit alcohol dehydrogenase family)